MNNKKTIEMGKNTEFMSINHSILDNLIQNILVLLSEPTAFPYRKWVWSLRKAEKNQQWWKMYAQKCDNPNIIDLCVELRPAQKKLKHLWFNGFF